MVTITVNDEIELRSYTDEDAPELFAAINDSRLHLGKWLDWVAHTTKPEHSLKFIKDAAHEAHMQKALSLGIFYKGKIVGGIGMLNWDHNTKKAHVGYWISKDHEGKGIVTRSMRSFVNFLFSKVGLNRIEIYFSVANKRSAKVAERVGGKIEGILRQSTLRNGMPEDTVVAGILKSEWVW